MAAYMVCTMRIHDPETYRKYTSRTPAIVARHHGRFLTRGDEVVTCEGETFTERLVILEFPDRAAALAWYNDPEYQDVSQYRRAASKGRMILQEGRSETAAPDPKV
jgi:uncharacterized protein (DUF1330 family)